MKKSLAYIFWLSLLVSSCDTFQEDMIPLGTDLFQPAEVERAVAPGSSLIIDFSGDVQASQPVLLGIAKAPVMGQVKILSAGKVEYIPNQSFTTGEDSFGINLMSLDSVVLDTDTIYVRMYETFDELPCFSGALGDYYEIPQGGSLSFSPLFNDGYCPDQVSAVEITMADPSVGSIEQLDDISFLYQSRDDFVGTVTSSYQVTFVNKDGERFSSEARVVIEVGVIHEEYPDCLDRLREFEGTEIRVPYANEIELPISLEELDCEVDIDLVKAVAEFGEVRFEERGLIYIPGEAHRDSADFITLTLAINEVDTATLSFTLIFQEEGLDCEMMAFPQLEPIHIFPGELMPEYRFQVIAGAPTCLFLPHAIEIREVTQGHAEFANDGTIIWMPPAEFENTETVISYAIVFEDGSSIEREILLLLEALDCERQTFPVLDELVIDELQDEYVFEVVNLQSLCFFIPWTVSIDFVSAGNAELRDGMQIVWQAPTDHTDSASFVIQYSINFEGGDKLDRVISIRYDDFGSSFECLEESFEHIFEEVESMSDQYAFQIYEDEDDCFLGDWTVEILEFNHGEVDVSADGTVINWQQFDDFDLQHLSIVYLVRSGGFEIIRHIDVVLRRDVTPVGCVEESFPMLHLVMDSIVDRSSFEIFRDVDDCDVPGWEVEILEVTQGDVELRESGRIIFWENDVLEPIEPIVHILYRIIFADGEFLDREIVFELDHSDPGICTNAHPDEYFYDLLSDTLNANIPAFSPLIMTPAANDFLCEDEFELEIVEEPEIGEAEVLQNTKISYVVNEEFAGTRDVSLKYRVCSGDQCDVAEIIITVRK